MLIKQVGLFSIIRLLVFNPIKIINLFQVLISYLFLKGKMWGVPPVLILEPTTYCQLRCPLCIKEHPQFKRNNIHLDISVIKELLGQIGNRICVVLLYNQGEPMLHPEIIEIIKLIKKYNIIVKISTNGNYKNDISKELINTGIDHLIYDIDGDTQEVYEKYRVGGSFDLLVENIKKITKAKKDSGMSKPIIEVRLIAMKHNINRVDKVKEIVDTLNVDLFTIKKCMIREEEEFKMINEFIPDKYNRLNISAPEKCKYPWIFFCVLADGQISLCCYDEKGEYVYGNIKNNPVQSILNKNKYIEMRTKIKTKAESVGLCRKCDLNNEFYSSYEKFKEKYKINILTF